MGTILMSSPKSCFITESISPNSSIRPSCNALFPVQINPENKSGSSFCCTPIKQS